MAMRLLALILGCSAYANHGRRVGAFSKHDSPENRQNLHELSDSGSTSSTALAKLLASNTPTVGWQTSFLGQGQGFAHRSRTRAVGMKAGGARSAAEALVSRRAALVGAAVFAAALPALGYDSIPKNTFDPVEVEKKRKEFEEQAAKEKKDRQPLVKRISLATTEDEFADAVNALSVYIIGKEQRLAPPDAKAIRDVIIESYEVLPKKRFKCEKTRTNEGVCFEPGVKAQDAKKSGIKTLREYAGKKNKGIMIGDGVTAVNIDPF